MFITFINHNQLTNTFQISAIENCKMTRLRVDLPFDFIDGSCSTLNAIQNHPSKIYLCFGSSDHKFEYDSVPFEYGCYYNNAVNV